jgi:hypothetical protein
MFKGSIMFYYLRGDLIYGYDFKSGNNPKIQIVSS